MHVEIMWNTMSLFSDCVLDSSSLKLNQQKIFHMHDSNSKFVLWDLLHVASFLHT